MRSSSTRAIGIATLTLQALLVVGCSERAASDDGGQAGEPAGHAGGGSGGSGGSGKGMSGGGGGRDTGFDTKLVDQLRACNLAEPCGESTVYLLEHDLPMLQTEEPTRCTLEALRDRRAGRYLHMAAFTNAAASRSLRHVLVVTEQGEVLHAAQSYNALGAPDAAPTAERCQPKDAAYFEDCLAGATAASVQGEGGAGNGAWQCLYGSERGYPAPLDWFDDCEPLDAFECP